MMWSRSPCGQRGSCHGRWTIPRSQRPGMRPWRTGKLIECGRSAPGGRGYTDRQSSSLPLSSTRRRESPAVLHRARPASVTTVVEAAAEMPAEGKVEATAEVPAEGKRLPRMYKTRAEHQRGAGLLLSSSEMAFRRDCAACCRRRRTCTHSHRRSCHSLGTSLRRHQARGAPKSADASPAAGAPCAFPSVLASHLAQWGREEARAAPGARTIAGQIVAWLGFRRARARLGRVTNAAGVP